MTSDIQPLLNELYNLQRLGIKTGLEHTFDLLDSCNNPHQDLKLIHIAGTNGKGSTAAFIFSILRAAGLKVGLYTSPHLVRFNERIRINGIPITDDNIVQFMKNHFEDIRRIESTFFETTTAMAFWHFAQQQVEVAVIETGLGGRLDSTNVIEPIVSVITPIGLDHQELLGDSLEAIAKEKAGIIKKEIPVVSSQQKEIVRTILESKAGKMNSNISFVEPPQTFSINLDGMTYLSGNKDISIPLLGKHQLVNASLALSVIETCFNSISEKDIGAGFKNTQWPGRLQVLSKDPPVFYDVAHNEQGIDKMMNTLAKLYDQKPMGVFGLKEDKELANISKKIKDKIHSLYIMDDNDQLMMNKHDLSKQLNQYGILSAPIKHVSEIRSKISKDRPSVIFGSHYMAEAIFKEFHFSFDTGVI